MGPGLPAPTTMMQTPDEKFVDGWFRTGDVATDGP